MMFWKKKPVRPDLSPALALLREELANARTTCDTFCLRMQHAEAKVEKLTAVIRQQNDADLYWAAREVMKQAEKPATDPARLSAYADMAMALSQNQQRQSVPYPWSVLGGLGSWQR